MAQTELVNRYLTLVYHTIFHLIHDAQLTEDLCQETFIRVFRALPQFQQHRSFKPWLLTIATNVSKSHLKKSWRQHETLMNYGDDEQSYKSIENQLDIAVHENPEESLMDEKQQEQLSQALAKLPEAMRQALILRHVHNLSYEEVAEALDAKINSVRTWLKRGRERLMVLLEQAPGAYHS